MEPKTVSEKLMLKFSEISKSELDEVSLLIAIIKKNIGDLISCNMKILGDEFVAKCEYYGEAISEVNSEQVEILNSYREEFNKIAAKIEEEYINLSLELQEIQANQKNSIVNMKKMLDLKQQYIETEEYKNAKENSITIVNDYNKKIDMLAEKYIKYCGLEEVCIIKLRDCNERIEKAINSVMQYEVENKLAVVEKKSIFSFFSKLFNKFSGGKRFQKEYIDKKRQNIDKIKASTNLILDELDNEINDSLIILDAYSTKINQVCG